MDFDDEDKPKEVSKTRRFVPGRAGKSKPKPEPTAVKAEPPSHTVPPPLETVCKNEHDVDVKYFAGAVKVEPEVYNGAVKMEIGLKLEPKPEWETAMKVEFMEEDQLPLQEEEEEEEEEEEDVVVREIDVFLNPSIDATSKLYVLQYPLRPSWRPYEIDERCEEVRVNPSTSEIEIDLPMDVYSKNYNSESGRELKMTKQTLTTTWTQPRALDYVVGVLSGDKLHLNPVHAVSQLRPSMQYLSSIGKRNQAESTEESVGTSKRQNKGALTDQTIPEENLVALKFHGLQSECCSTYLNQMMAKENSSIDFNMSLDVYINSLCHGERRRNSDLKDPLKRVSTSLPLKERVQMLVCAGPPLIRYSVLRHYAQDESDEEFLRALQQSACLVQGLWTPKTSILKLDSPLGASRDYVLSLFNKDSVITYSQVEATGRRREKVKDMLNVFAKERPLLRDWKFKEPRDVSFIKSHPEIVEKQNVIWKAIEEKLEAMIQGERSKANNLRMGVTKSSVTSESQLKF